MNPWLFPDGVYTSPPSLTAIENVQKELTDTISCVVEREINGIYELTMTYPINGTKYEDIALRSLLYVEPDDQKPRQLFRIYKISKPLRGVVTIWARHISYDLSGYVRPPFSASGIQATLSAITTNTQPGSCPFSFTTTRTTASNFSTATPDAIWSLMAGKQGSLMDVYGGEYDFDNFDITLENRLGEDSGVTIEYGKNLTALLQDENSGTLYTGIYPYYYNDPVLVTLPEGVIDGPVVWPFVIYKPVDMTDKFESEPTEAQLRAAAQAYVQTNDVGVPKVTIDVDFVPLWQTLEYAGDAREIVHLGDTVSVVYTALGVDATARIMAYRWDCLRGRYEKLTVGSAKADMAQVIQQMINASTGTGNGYPNANGVSF